MKSVTSKRTNGRSRSMALGESGRVPVIAAFTLMIIVALAIGMQKVGTASPAMAASTEQAAAAAQSNN